MTSPSSCKEGVLEDQYIYDCKNCGGRVRWWDNQHGLKGFGHVINGNGSCVKPSVNLADWKLFLKNKSLVLRSYYLQ